MQQPERVTADADQVESPCIRVCTLDAGQICVGCGRSLDEIAAWSRLSAQEKRAVCALALERKVSRGTTP